MKVAGQLRELRRRERELVRTAREREHVVTALQCDLHGFCTGPAGGTQNCDFHGPTVARNSTERNAPPRADLRGEHAAAAETRCNVVQIICIVIANYHDILK